MLGGWADAADKLEGGRGADSAIGEDPAIGGYNSPTSISCPSVALCAATDNSGNVVSTTDPTAGASAWTAAQVGPAQPDNEPPGPLSDVSCLGGSACVAVAYDEIASSANSTGGASAWSLSAVSPDPYSSGMTAVSCPSASLCVAADSLGDFFASTDPIGASASWPEDNGSGPQVPVSRISCPSTSLCVAVGSSGDAVTSTTPDGGGWTDANIDPTNSLAGVSCPSPSLCVAVDGVGNVVTSSNPTGGASTSTVTNVDGATALDAVSCPSLSLCVAVDAAGNALVSSDPTGGAGAWTATRVEAHDQLTGVSCPSATLCIAIDESGDALVGTGTETGTQPVTVTAAAAAPAAAPSNPPSCSNVRERAAEGSTGAVRLSCHDGDGEPLTYHVVSGPSHGTLGTPTGGGSVSYKPRRAFVGQDTFSYRATAADGTSNTATAHITVTASKQASPRCSSRRFAFASGSLHRIRLLCADPGHHRLSYVIVSRPKHGKLSRPNARGRVRYTARARYRGRDAFRYRATAADGRSRIVTVRILVTRRGRRTGRRHRATR